MRLFVAYAGQRTCTQFGITLMAILYKRCLFFVPAVFSLVSAPIKSSVSMFAKVQLHQKESLHKFCISPIRIWKTESSCFTANSSHSIEFEAAFPNNSRGLVIAVNIHTRVDACTVHPTKIQGSQGTRVFSYI